MSRFGSKKPEPVTRNPNNGNAKASLANAKGSK